jgi:hypothetical protein
MDLIQVGVSVKASIKKMPESVLMTGQQGLVNGIRSSGP